MASSATVVAQLSPPRYRQIVDEKKPVIDRTLIVTVTRRFYEDLLSKYGCDFAPNGKVAVEFYESELEVSSIYKQSMFVTTDAAYEDMTALEVLNALFKVPQAAGLPYMVLSKEYRVMVKNKQWLNTDKILVVDESRDFFNRIKKLLKRQTKNVVECNTYAKALAELGKPNVKLVIADHSMIEDGNIDGFVGAVGIIPLFLTVPSLTGIITRNRWIRFSPAALISKPLDDMRHGRFLKLL